MIEWHPDLQPRPPLQAYSLGRSVAKGLGALAQSAAALLATVALALYADPELAGHAREIAAGHPKALAALGALVFLGKVLADWKKHRQ